MFRAALVLVVGLSACNLDQEFTDSVPTTDEVTIAVPARTGAVSSQSTAAGLGAQASALLGATSDLYQLTYDVSSTLNGATVLVVGVLRVITLQPPSSRTSSSRLTCGMA